MKKILISIFAFIFNFFIYSQNADFLYSKFINLFDIQKGKMILLGDIDLLNNEISYSALSILSNEELRLLRNLVYAKKGASFKSKELNDYFENFYWSKETKKTIAEVEKELSDIDKKNIAKIKICENNKKENAIDISAFSYDWGYDPRPGNGLTSCLSLFPDKSFNYREDNRLLNNISGTYEIYNNCIEFHIFSISICSGDAIWIFDNYPKLLFEDYIDNSKYKKICFDKPIILVLPLIEYRNVNSEDKYVPKEFLPTQKLMKIGDCTFYSFKQGLY